MTKYYLMTLKGDVRGSGKKFEFIRFQAYTTQWEVVRWFKLRHDSLKYIEVIETECNGLKELFEVCMAYWDDVMDWSDFAKLELEMEYSGNKCVPIYINDDDLIEQYALSEFVSDSKNVLNELYYLALFMKPKSNVDMIKIIVSVITLLRNYYSDWFTHRSNLFEFDKKAILINFVEKEGLSYYEGS